MASPTREAVAGWSARQDYGSDGDGGWQGWGPAHPSRVPPGVIGWKGMATELAEQAGSVQGEFASCCCGEETDETEMSLRGPLSQGPWRQGEGTLHLTGPAPPLQGCAQPVLSSLVLAWSAHPEGLGPASASSNLFLFRTHFLQNSPINPTWLPSGLEERPMAAVLARCGGRDMLSMEYLGC